jgi:hypothetical protein
MGHPRGILEHHMKPEENKRDSQNEDEQIRPEVRAEIHFPESIEIKRAADQESQHTTQKVIAVAAWFAFIAALCYAVIAQRQLGQMQEQTAQIYRQSEVENANASAKAFEMFRQLNISKEQATAARDAVIQATIESANNSKRVEQQLKIAGQQAKAAQDSAIAIQRQIRQDQRAWMVAKIDGAKEIEISKAYTVTGQFINTGKTAARSVLIRYVVGRVKNGEDPIFSYGVPHEGIDPGQVVPNRAIEFRAHEVQRDPTSGELIPISLTADDFSTFSQMQWFFVVYGTIDYLDAFGVPHWTHFCIWQATAESTTQRVGHWTARKCTDYNDADNN